MIQLCGEEMKHLAIIKISKGIQSFKNEEKAEFEICKLNQIFKGNYVKHKPTKT